MALGEKDSSVTYGNNSLKEGEVAGAGAEHLALHFVYLGLSLSSDGCKALVYYPFKAADKVTLGQAGDAAALSGDTVDAVVGKIPHFFRHNAFSKSIVGLVFPVKSSVLKELSVFIADVGAVGILPRGAESFIGVKHTGFQPAGRPLDVEADAAIIAAHAADKDILRLNGDGLVCDPVVNGACALSDGVLIFVLFVILSIKFGTFNVQRGVVLVNAHSPVKQGLHSGGNRCFLHHIHIHSPLPSGSAITLGLSGDSTTCIHFRLIRRPVHQIDLIIQSTLRLT